MTRIGVLIDFPWAYPDTVRRPLEDSLRMALDEAREDGLVDREIEIVYKFANGLPVGGTFEVLQAWRALTEEDGCVAVFGPISSENAIAVRNYIEKTGEVSSITWGGTDRWNGTWCFAMNQGSLADEPYLIANYLGHSGTKRVAAVVETSAIGDEYFRYFKEACRFEGIEIVLHEEVDALDADFAATVQRLRAAAPDALAYFGFGLPAVTLSAELRTAGWDPLRVMCAGFMTAPLLPGGWNALDGWVGVDLYDAGNDIGRDFLDRFEARFGYRPENYLAVNAFDIGQLLAAGISKARPVSPDGVRTGLESVKMLPAASGGPGTMLGFAPYAHSVWQGSAYIVLSRVQAGFEAEGLMSTGSTEVVHRMTPRSRSERHGPSAAASSQKSSTSATTEKTSDV
jgi:branched-chain amino acid transport system substrate-binding protein